MNLNSESQICLLSYVYGFQLQDPVWARTVDLKLKDVQNPDPDLKKNQTYFDEFEYFATGLESPSSSKSSGTGTNPL